MLNPLQRTAQKVIESNLPNASELLANLAPKKAFQYVKHVTGKMHNDITDYSVSKLDDHYGNETIAIVGKLGYVRLTLEPLFKLI